MRQTIRKRKSQEKKDRLITFLAFFVFAPIVAIIIGFMIVNYVIFPMFAEKDKISITDEERNINDGTETDATDEETTDTSVENNNMSNDISNENQKTLTINREGINLFNVQVGSFNDINNAKELTAKMKEHGFGGYIVKTTNYKVFAGSFYNREEADRLLAEIKKIYNDAFITNIIINKGTIGYNPLEQQYADKLIEILDTIEKSYGEEMSLWLNTLLSNNSELLITVMKNNTDLIESKVTSIKDKCSSEGLKDMIINIENLVSKRKEIITNIEKNTDNLVDNYREFNESFFKIGL